MAVCRKLLLPSMISALFCFSILSANLEERTSEGFEPVAKKENDEYIGLDTQHYTADNSGSNKASKGYPSTILPRHQALIFDPPSLDFRECSVGMPSLQTVRITNPSSTQPLQLTSISGDSPTFHASFFKSKVVKAGESTSFDVVFLARTVGSTRNILYIQSSQGTFEYEAQGVGTGNPFRLRSLLGAKIPVNATYSPLISMYNPYSQVLQITEMYSSSGQLHIELLTGQTEGAKELWEIKPFETKPIARASFFGGKVANHTSYIRVKTSHKSHPSLVLPVQVEVSDQSGLYLSRELLDFGVIKGGEIKVLPLYVLNTGQQQVHIKSVSVSPKNSAIEIEYMTTLLRPGSKYTKIALLKFSGDQVRSHDQMSGHVIIRAEDRFLHTVEVPYDANVLNGTLLYDTTATLFRPEPSPLTPVTRKIPLSNRLTSPVVIYDAKLPSKAHEYFTVPSGQTPLTLPPATSGWQRELSVVFKPSSSDCQFNTVLKLTTNSSYFSVPLVCYDGTVRYTLENRDEDSLEFGVLSQTDVAVKTFTLHNINPVKISIISFSLSSDLPFTSIQLESIHSANSTPNSHAPSKPYKLDPDFQALFSVTVTKPDSIGTFSGEVIVHTSFDKELHVPVFFVTSASKLKVTPEAINFERGFPYLRGKVPLSVKNLYNQAVDVTSVSTSVGEPRIYFEESPDGLPRLMPSERLEIGVVVFDPCLGDEEDVYLMKEDSELWASSVTPRDASGEARLLSSMRALWRSMENNEKTFLNLSVVVHSGADDDVSVPVTASLVWPELVLDHVIPLPDTTIGNTSVHHFHISNPSGHPLLVQPVLLSQYNHPQAILDSLSDRFNPKLKTLNYSLSSNPFSIITSSKEDPAPMATIPPHDNTFKVSISFSPKVDQKLNMLLLLRNNLTVLDYVLLQGIGVQGSFAIDGVQPGTEPLMFEYSDSVMENCLAHVVVDPYVDSLRLIKTFRMHNSGPTAITVRLLGLEGGSCTGRGFSIANCHKDITIKPSRSKKIEITFDPDYTLTQVSATLKIRLGNGNELLYPLLAILPQQLLAACIALQPMPELEKTLAWLSAPFWLFVIIAIVATVFIQTRFGMRKDGLSFWEYNKSSPPTTSSEVFDLNTLTKSVQSSLSKKIQELEDKSLNESTQVDPEKEELPSVAPATVEPEPKVLSEEPPLTMPAPTVEDTKIELSKSKTVKFPAPVSPSPPVTHTGVKQEPQPVQVVPSPPKNRRTEKTTQPKSDSPVKPLSEAVGKRSKLVRKITPRSVKVEISPLPAVQVKQELERKASESSINSDAASTSTDKSEEVETPSSLVTTFVQEVKKPAPAKEPNTGQTIHPPDTPDSIAEAVKIEPDPPKKDSIAQAKMKGKKKQRQLKKEEKAARKKEKEREKERIDKDKTDDLSSKPSAMSSDDSSSSNSTEQLEESSSSLPAQETLTAETGLSESVDYKVVDDVVETDGPVRGSLQQAPVSVPSTAIKTGRAKASKPSTKVPALDPSPQQPDRTGKKTISKRATEKSKNSLVLSSGKSTPPPIVEEQVDDNMDSDSPRQRPQTLPVIRTEEADEVDLVCMDDCSSVETDGVTGGLLGVESGKSNGQSLPTSPHELAASLLSNNSAIMKRKQRSDKDDKLDDEYDDIVPDKELCQITEPIKLSPTSKDAHLKPSTLSLDAEPFYPSPTTHLPPPKHQKPSPDPRKYPESRGLPPPGFHPTPEDPFVGPYPEHHYYKRDLHRPIHGVKSVTPSPPLGPFPDPHMSYGDYPYESHDHMDDPVSMPPEDLIPPPRYQERYRPREPVMMSKRVPRPMPPMDYLYQQHHQYARAMREFGHPLRRAPQPSFDDALHYHQQYLKKRQYILSLIKQEKALAAVERHGRPPVDNSMFPPEPSSLRGWDSSEFSEHSNSRLQEELDLLRYRNQQQSLQDQRPVRSHTFSTDSELGGEFVSDLSTPSSVGAPGQQFSSSVGAKSLAPGRARSSGWPEETQSLNTPWEASPWSSDSVLYSDAKPPQTTPQTSSASYDLFDNQSIWSVSNSDTSTLFSWDQLKSELSESKD